jgi:hypothetical protein
MDERSIGTLYSKAVIRLTSTSLWTVTEIEINNTKPPSGILEE